MSAKGLVMILVPVQHPSLGCVSLARPVFDWNCTGKARPTLRTPTLNFDVAMNKETWIWLSIAVILFAWAEDRCSAQEHDPTVEVEPSIDGSEPHTNQAAIDFFETRIRPILVARCYECHSQSHSTASNGLRLDARERVLAGGDSGSAIQVDNPSDSLLIRALRGQNAERMPPEGEPLAESQIVDFEHWIRSGLPFPSGSEQVDGADRRKNHWAYRSPQASPLPNLAGNEFAAQWCWNAIDARLFAAMDAQGIRPMGDAPLAWVARRLSTVLTGLPPTPDDLDRLEELGIVDRQLAIQWYADLLLASPAFGERWSRHWMDLVRYAEGAGSEYDYEIHGAWRYRDYLVRALNGDLPFDRWVQEHIAGDLIEPRVVQGRNESLLATAWWNFGEGVTAPVDLANDEAERMDARLDVLGRAFSGTTLGCARCHDHKFDPIPTDEYYGLYGVAVAAPTLRTWANEPQFQAYGQRLLAIRNAIDQRTHERLPLRSVPSNRISNSGPSSQVTHQASPSTSSADDGDDRVVFDSRSVHRSLLAIGHVETVAEQEVAMRGVSSGLWTGLLSKKLPALVRTESWVVDRPYIDLWVRGKDSTVQVVVANYQMIRDPIYNGLRQRIDSDEWRWMRFQVGRWTGRRVHVEVFTGTVDNASRILNTQDTPDNQFGLRRIIATHSERPEHPWAESDGGNGVVWKTRALNREQRTQLDQLMADKEQLEGKVPMPERFLGIGEVAGSNCPTHVRGDANKTRTELAVRKPLAIWHRQEPFAVRSGRQELADSLTSGDNPLPPRVMVNRMWHHAFGTGLVASVDNFGLLGEPPSHPELLDDLALRWVHVHRWSVKRMLREIVTSRAFQVRSAISDPRDPTNRWLSRYPLRRLDAEALRDCILASTDLLDRRVGGEPIPVPHAWQTTFSDSGNNVPESGPIDGANRRSLYLSVRRHFPSQWMETFDRPAPQAASGRRDAPCVPAHALTLLNDPFVEQQLQRWCNDLRSATMLGQNDPSSDVLSDNLVRSMYRTTLARWPTSDELARAREILGSDSLDQSLADFGAMLINAKEYLYVP